MRALAATARPAFLDFRARKFLCAWFLRAFAAPLLLTAPLLFAPFFAAAQERAETVRVVVAVLPFEVHSARPLDYLEGSLAELLSTRLEAGGRIRVLETLTLREALISASAERSEDAVRALAQKVGAAWVVFGSLTELAGQYSLDVRVTPATSNKASAALSYAADNDDELLDRMDELAERVSGIVTGTAAKLRVASVEVRGAPNAVAARAVLRVRAGDAFSDAALREDLTQLAALAQVATASADTQSGPDGMRVVYQVVPAETAVAAAPGASAAQHAGRVAEVRVRGNQRIEAAAILSRIGTTKGGAFSPPQISEDLREIHGLGYFSDAAALVETRADGQVVIFEVQENPVVRQVTLTGNDEVDEEKIKDNLTLTTGATLDQPLLFENRLRIEAIYRAEGFYLARVRHEVEELPGDAVAIHFTVDEGEKLKLRDIAFEGNEAFDDGELLDEFKTKSWRWHSWVTRIFNKSGTYSEPVFMQDLRTVSDRYFDHGYIRAEVGEPVVTPSDNGLTVVVRITEGPKFKVNSLDVKGDETIDVNRLRLVLRLREGEVFNRSALNDDIEALEHQYTDRGFYAAKVEPLTRVADAEETVDVVFEVEKGPLYFLRELDISGNTNTVDSVVRREMQMVEGELYSARAVDISKRRVEVLGFFEEVNIEPRLTDYPDQLSLDLKVVERPTGSLSFGAGYSSRDGFVLSGSVTQTNLFGRGYGGSVSADFGNYSDRYFLSFSDPYFLDTTFGFQARTFQTSVEFEDFNLDTRGAELVLSHLLDNAGRTRAFLRYSWTQRDVQRSASAIGAAPILREVASAGETTSLLGLSMRRDTRNDRIAPTFGEITEFSLDAAGLGGFSQFLRVEARTVRYVRNPRWVPRWLPSSSTGTWVIGARFGWTLPFNDVSDFDFSNINPYEGGAMDLMAPYDTAADDIVPRKLSEIDTDIDLPLSERYFLGGIGGYQLRGFESRSIGPRRVVLQNVRASSVYTDANDVGDTDDVYLPSGWGVRAGEGNNPDTLVCLATATGGDPAECNRFDTTRLDDFADLEQTDVIGGNKFLSGTIEYRFPISEALGLIGIAFVDYGNAFAEEEDVWDFDLWRVGTGVGALWFSPFGPLQAFFGVPLDPHADEDSSVFEFTVGGQTF